MFIDIFITFLHRLCRSIVLPKNYLLSGITWILLELWLFVYLQKSTVCLSWYVNSICNSTRIHHYSIYSSNLKYHNTVTLLTSQHVRVVFLNNPTAFVWPTNHWFSTIKRTFEKSLLCIFFRSFLSVFLMDAFCKRGLLICFATWFRDW